jgi:serine/threonine-protein kinase
MPSELLSSEYLEDLAQPHGAAGLGAGTRLGRYELLAPIATGRMATVWAARLIGHRGFSKLVAIKTILPQLAREPLFERMFLDEARIASSIHHPNVCEIYEFGEDRGHLHLVMEWVSGDSLAHLIAAGAHASSPIAPRVAARIVADACAGLSAAHDLAVVHRDISAENVLVSENGTIKLADFGVATALDRSQETSSGYVKGKLAYAAPEYIASGRADRRTDVFSMGVVLYEATLGVLPFTGDRDAAVMAAIMRGEPARPRDLDASYPRELEAIVLGAIARDPEARFQSAEALGRSLEEWLARSGPPIMQSAVTNLVASRIGAQLEERRAALRETMRVLDEPSPAPISVERVAASRSLSPWPSSSPAPMTPLQPATVAPFSSYPPAPLAFAPPSHETRRHPSPSAPSRSPMTPLILVAVVISMCAVLGVVGRQALRRSPHAASAAPADLRGSPAAEESIELPVDPPPAPFAGATAMPTAAALAIPSASAQPSANTNTNTNSTAALPRSDIAPAPTSIPTVSASTLPNVPAAPPAPAARPMLPPNPY